MEKWAKTLNQRKESTKVAMPAPAYDPEPERRKEPEPPPPSSDKSSLNKWIVLVFKVVGRLATKTSIEVVSAFLYFFQLLENELSIF